MVPNKENAPNPNHLRLNNANFDDGAKAFGIHDNGNKKPLISPVRHQFKADLEKREGEQWRGRGEGEQQQPMDWKSCVNHPSKSAEFSIDIDEERLLYCGRCAAQLASQGFEVSRLETATVKKGLARPEEAKGMPQFPEYEGNAMYELIVEFLGELTGVEREHAQNMGRLSTMDEHYCQQVELTKGFYAELLGFVEQMRDDHLSDLFEQSRKHSQVADIEHDYLRENVEELANIRTDIEDNLEVIVERLGEADLRSNLNYYRQKLQVYRHRVEEQSDFFQEVISFAPEQYRCKLQRAQHFLMDVWKHDQPPTADNPLPSKQSLTQRDNEYLMKAPTPISLPKATASNQNIKKSGAVQSSEK
jgi:hypothetical protein